MHSKLLKNTWKQKSEWAEGCRRILNDNVYTAQWSSQVSPATLVILRHHASSATDEPVEFNREHVAKKPKKVSDSLPTTPQTSQKILPIWSVNNQEMVSDSRHQWRQSHEERRQNNNQIYFLVFPFRNKKHRATEDHRTWAPSCTHSEHSRARWTEFNLPSKQRCIRHRCRKKGATFKRWQRQTSKSVATGGAWPQFTVVFTLTACELSHQTSVVQWFWKAPGWAAAAPQDNDRCCAPVGWERTVAGSCCKLVKTNRRCRTQPGLAAEQL